MFCVNRLSAFPTIPVIIEYSKQGFLDVKNTDHPLTAKGDKLAFCLCSPDTVKEHWVGLYLCYDISHLRFGQ